MKRFLRLFIVLTFALTLLLPILPASAAGSISITTLTAKGEQSNSRTYYYTESGVPMVCYLNDSSPTITVTVKNTTGSSKILRAKLSKTQTQAGIFHNIGTKTVTASTAAQSFTFTLNLADAVLYGGWDDDTQWYLVFTMDNDDGTKTTLTNPVYRHLSSNGAVYSTDEGLRVRDEEVRVTLKQYNGVTSTVYETYLWRYTSLDSPTRTGYTFFGWTANSNRTYTGTFYYLRDTSNPKGVSYQPNVVNPLNHTLYDVWTVNQYKVTCIDKVGSSSGTTLGSKTWSAPYGSTVYGSTAGSNTAVGAWRAIRA